jgi:DNA repair protein RadC
MKIDSSQKAFAILSKHIAIDVEEFWVLALNSSLEIINKKMLFRGTVDRCPFHPRDLIRFLCSQNASCFVIAHNHPSGDSRPSQEDLEITKKIFVLSALVEIPLKDHLILSKENYFSFADTGWLKKISAPVDPDLHWDCELDVH